MLIGVAEGVEKGLAKNISTSRSESRWTDIKWSNHSSLGLGSGRESSSGGITGRLSTIQSWSPASLTGG